jgi:hypothetical protein
MKVAIKISLQQLGSLVYSFNHIAKLPVTDREEKVRRSCLDKIVIKLKKKHVEEAYKATLFLPKKKLNFTMEFHEAYFLEKFLTIIDDFPLNEYDRNVLRFIRHDLNQKTA